MFFSYSKKNGKIPSKIGSIIHMNAGSDCLIMLISFFQLKFTKHILIIIPNIATKHEYKILNTQVNINVLIVNFKYKLINNELIKIDGTLIVKLSNILLKNIVTGFTGIVFIIHAFFPSSEIDGCVVHVRRLNVAITSGVCLSISSTIPGVPSINSTFSPSTNIYTTIVMISIIDPIIVLRI